MPRSGGGVYSKPAGTTAVTNTTIESAKYNSVIDDLVTDANAARPVSAGGTGAANAADARTNLGISATNTPFTPTGAIAATNVQAALAELDTEKAIAANTYTKTEADERYIRATGISPLAYGAVGDGVADDTTALDTTRVAADAAGLPIDGSGRRYLISGSGILSPQAGIRNATFLMTGVGTARSFPDTTRTCGVSLLGGDLWGGSWPTATITGTVDRTTTSFTVSNGALFTQGQRVLIHENTVWGNAKANSSETLTAVSVSQTVFTMGSTYVFNRDGQSTVQVETGVGTNSYTTLTGSTQYTLTDASATLTLASGVAIGVRVIVTRQFGTDFARRSESAIIKTVVGNTVTLSKSVRGVYGTGAGATLRAYPDVNPTFENVHIIDAEDSDVNFGLFVMNCNRVHMENCSVGGVYRTGISVFGCALLTGGNIRVEGATQRGLGYGLLLSGTDITSLTSVFGTRCRHMVTSGGGPSGSAGGFPLNSLISIGVLTGTDLSDAIFDAHPGVRDLTLGQVHGTFDVTAEDGIGGSANDGDGFLWQGGGQLKIGSIALFGFRRTGVALQPYGNGDQEIVSYWIGSLTARSSSTAASAYGFAFDDQFSYPNGYDIAGIQIDHIDVKTNLGMLVATRRNSMDRINIKGGRVEAIAAAGTAMLTQNFSSAAPYPQPTYAGRVIEISASDVWFVVPNTPTGTGRPAYIQGTSGYTTAIAYFGRCVFSGGVASARIDHGAARVVAPTYANAATNNFTTGTGGSFLTASFV
jgi:hypothetical protein